MEKAKKYVALDLETTGLDAKGDRIIEIGAVKFVDGVRVSEFASFVNPQMDIPARITDITGISDDMVADAPYIDSVLPKLLEYIDGFPILGHNIMFDYGFVKQKAMLCGLEVNCDGIDTHIISKAVLSQLPSRSLENLCTYYGIVEEPRHRAFSDAAATARLYDCLYDEVCRWQENDDERMDCIKKENMFLPKQLVYQVKKDYPLTKKQEEFLKKLIKQYNINYEKEIESLTKSQASREIDLILSTYGRKY